MRNKLTRKIICAVVAILFSINDLCYGLGIQPMTAQPGGQARLAGEYVKRLGYGRNTVVDNYIPSFEGPEFIIDPSTGKRSPLTENVRFIESDPNSIPEEWLKSSFFKALDQMKDDHGKVDMAKAMKYFMVHEAGLPEDTLEFRHGYYGADEEGGVIPVDRIEQVVEQGSVKYACILDTRMTQKWADLLEHDVRYEYTFPDGKKRIVSVAWSIFFRTAKHIMTDLKKADLEKWIITPKGQGMGHFTRGVKNSPHHYESLANIIDGRYWLPNDAAWLWFTQSYCLDDTRRYDNNKFKERLDWFFSSMEARQLGLPQEFPEFLEYAEAREESKELAHFINYHYFSRLDIRAMEPVVDPKSELITQFEARVAARKAAGILERHIYTGGRDNPQDETPFKRTSGKDQQDLIRLIALNIVDAKTFSVSSLLKWLKESYKELDIKSPLKDRKLALSMLRKNLFELQTSLLAQGLVEPLVDLNEPESVFDAKSQWKKDEAGEYLFKLTRSGSEEAGDLNAYLHALRVMEAARAAEHVRQAPAQNGTFAPGDVQAAEKVSEADVRDIMNLWLGDVPEATARLMSRVIAAYDIKNVRAAKTVVGVPKEIKPQAERVGLTPVGVSILTRLGIPVIVEKGAGRMHFSDKEYEAAGAKLVDTAEEVWKRATIVKKVKEPLANEQGDEYKLLGREGQVLFTYLHLASQEAERLNQELIRSRATAIGYETVVVGRKTPLLEPMSIIAGDLGGFFPVPYILHSRIIGEGASRKVELTDAGRAMMAEIKNRYEDVFYRDKKLFENELAGKEAVVMGGGVSGERMARRLLEAGASVTITDINDARLAELRRKFEEYSERLTLINPGKDINAPEPILMQKYLSADILGGCILDPGGIAPQMSKDLLAKISAQKTKFIVDIALDQGGNFYGSYSRKYSDPVFIDEFGNTRFCVPNMPDFVGKVSSTELEKTNIAYTVALAMGLGEGVKIFPELLGGVNTFEGKITHKKVSEAYPALPYMDLDQAIAPASGPTVGTSADTLSAGMAGSPNGPAPENPAVGASGAIKYTTLRQSPVPIPSKIKVLFADDPANKETLDVIRKELARRFGGDVEIIAEHGGGNDKDWLRARIEKYKPNVIIVRSDTKAFKPEGEGADPGIFEFAKANGVKAIIRAGVAYENIDTDKARENGISVARTHGSANSVADLTLFLLAALDKKLGGAKKQGSFTAADIEKVVKTAPDEYLKLITESKKWGPISKEQKQEFINKWKTEIFDPLAGNELEALARVLNGRTIGLLGWGPIAQAVAEKLALVRKLLPGISFTVLAHSRSLTSDDPVAKELGVTPVSREELFKNSDIVSIHLPAVPGLELIKKELASEKLKAIINTSRSQLVNPKALESFANLRRIFYLAYLDFTDELIRLIANNRDNVINFPHIGVSTRDGGSGVEENTISALIEMNELLLGMKNSSEIQTLQIVNGVTPEPISSPGLENSKDRGPKDSTVDVETGLSGALKRAIDNPNLEDLSQAVAAYKDLMSYDPVGIANETLNLLIEAVKIAAFDNLDEEAREECFLEAMVRFGKWERIESVLTQLLSHDDNELLKIAAVDALASFIITKHFPCSPETRMALEAGAKEKKDNIVADECKRVLQYLSDMPAEAPATEGRQPDGQDSRVQNKLGPTGHGGPVSSSPDDEARFIAQGKTPAKDVEPAAPKTKIIPQGKPITKKTNPKEVKPFDTYVVSPARGMGLVVGGTPRTGLTVRFAGVDEDCEFRNFDLAPLYLATGAEMNSMMSAETKRLQHNKEVLESLEKLRSETASLAGAVLNQAADPTQYYISNEGQSLLRGALAHRRGFDFSKLYDVKAICYATLRSGKERRENMYTLLNLSAVENLVLHYLFPDIIRGTEQAAPSTNLSHLRSYRAEAVVRLQEILDEQGRLSKAFEEAVIHEQTGPYKTRFKMIDRWIRSTGQSQEEALETIREWIRQAMPVLEVALWREFPETGIQPRDKSLIGELTPEVKEALFKNPAYAAMPLEELMSKLDKAKKERSRIQRLMRVMRTIHAAIDPAKTGMASKSVSAPEVAALDSENKALNREIGLLERAIGDKKRVDSADNVPIRLMTAEQLAAEKERMEERLSELRDNAEAIIRNPGDNQAEELNNIGAETDIVERRIELVGKQLAPPGNSKDTDGSGKAPAAAETPEEARPSTDSGLHKPDMLGPAGHGSTDGEGPSDNEARFIAPGRTVPTAAGWWENFRSKLGAIAAQRRLNKAIKSGQVPPVMRKFRKKFALDELKDLSVYALDRLVELYEYPNIYKEARERAKESARSGRKDDTLYRTYRGLNRIVIAIIRNMGLRVKYHSDGRPKISVIGGLKTLKQAREIRRQIDLAIEREKPVTSLPDQSDVQDPLGLGKAGHGSTDGTRGSSPEEQRWIGGIAKKPESTPGVDMASSKTDNSRKDIIMRHRLSRMEFFLAKIGETTASFGSPEKAAEYWKNIAKKLGLQGLNKANVEELLKFYDSEVKSGARHANSLLRGALNEWSDVAEASVKPLPSIGFDMRHVIRGVTIGGQRDGDDASAQQTGPGMLPGTNIGGQRSILGEVGSGSSDGRPVDRDTQDWIAGRTPATAPASSQTGIPIPGVEKGTPATDRKPGENLNRGKHARAFADLIPDMNADDMVKYVIDAGDGYSMTNKAVSTLIKLNDISKLIEFVTKLKLALLDEATDVNDRILTAASLGGILERTGAAKAIADVQAVGVSARTRVNDILSRFPELCNINDNLRPIVIALLYDRELLGRSPKIESNNDNAVKIIFISPASKCVMSFSAGESYPHPPRRGYLRYNKPNFSYRFELSVTNEGSGNKVIKSCVATAREVSSGKFLTDIQRLIIENLGRTGIPDSRLKELAPVSKVGRKPGEVPDGGESAGAFRRRVMRIPIGERVDYLLGFMESDSSASTKFHLALEILDANPEKLVEFLEKLLNLLTDGKVRDSRLAGKYQEFVTLQVPDLTAESPVSDLRHYEVSQPGIDILRGHVKTIGDLQKMAVTKMINFGLSDIDINKIWAALIVNNLEGLTPGVESGEPALKGLLLEMEAAFTIVASAIGLGGPFSDEAQEAFRSMAEVRDRYTLLLKGNPKLPMRLVFQLFHLELYYEGKYNNIINNMHSLALRRNEPAINGILHDPNFLTLYLTAVALNYRNMPEVVESKKTFFEYCGEKLFNEDGLFELVKAFGGTEAFLDRVPAAVYTSGHALALLHLRRGRYDEAIRVVDNFIMHISHDDALAKPHTDEERAALLSLQQDLIDNPGSFILSAGDIAHLMKLTEARASSPGEKDSPRPGALAIDKCLELRSKITAEKKAAASAEGGMRTKPEAGPFEKGNNRPGNKFLITPENWFEKPAPRRPYIPVKGQSEEPSAGAFSVPVKYVLPKGPRINVTEPPEEALKIPVSRADPMNQQNLTAWSLALSPQELRESIQELKRLITGAESESRSMTKKLQNVADTKRKQEIIKLQEELERLMPIFAEQLRVATRELARKIGNFATPEGLEPGGSPEEFEAPATEPQDQAKGLRRLMKANREKTGAQGADGDVSKTPEQDIAPVNPNDRAAGLRAEAALREQHAANVEATKDHTLIRILDYAVQSGRGYGPDSETLSVAELGNIYRTVAALNDSHIEIYVPQSFGMTKIMKDALKDIGKRQNKEIVKLREFSDEKHLIGLLREKPGPGTKRIVLTEAINKNALASALAYALQGGGRDILDSFRSLKLLSVSFFKEYEGMRSEEKTVHQFKLMNIAMLALLFKKGDTAVGTFLRDMLKSCFGDDAASIDAVMEELGMPDERLNSLAVEDLIDRFARLLARPISLAERIGQEIRLMKNFLIAA